MALPPYSRQDTRPPLKRGGKWPPLNVAIGELGFWSACPRAACQRARACIGDAERCWDRLRPYLSEGAVEEIRRVLRRLKA